MRAAHLNEQAEILEAYAETMGYPNVEDVGQPQIGVNDDYITDGPGFSGKVAVIFWGGSEDWITLMKYEGGKWVVGVDTAWVGYRPDHIRG